MDLIKFTYILLMIFTCSYASPVLPTEKSVQSLLKSTISPIIKSNGVSTVKSAPSPTTTQSSLIKVRVLPYRSTEVRQVKENSKTDTLYQMATSLLQKEKNWLQTEKWLIDNVYRLKNELGDIKRELSDQKKLNSILTQKNQRNQPQLQIISNNDQARSNFIQDLSALRADHTLINQQQQHLIQLTKDNHEQIQNQSDLIKQWIAIIKEHYKMEIASKPIISLKQINESSDENAKQAKSELTYHSTAPIKEQKRVENLLTLLNGKIVS